MHQRDQHHVADEAHLQEVKPEDGLREDRRQQLSSWKTNKISVADFNNDGNPDLYFTSSRFGSDNALFLNKGDGTFHNHSEHAGLGALNRAGEGVSMGAVWGDYDNDGYEDLFVYKYGRPELFHSEQGRTFTRVSDRAGLPPWINANALTSPHTVRRPPRPA